jgi:CRISPR-associated protein Cas2
MQITYFVTYDICDDARLRKVFLIMKGAGEHAQYSVFRCNLTDRAKEELITDLLQVIHAGQDQVLFIDLGPAAGRAATCVSSLGLPYEPPKRGRSSSDLAPRGASAARGEPRERRAGL